MFGIVCMLLIPLTFVIDVASKFPITILSVVLCIIGFLFFAFLYSIPNRFIAGRLAAIIYMVFFIIEFAGTHGLTFLFWLNIITIIIAVIQVGILAFVSWANSAHNW